MINWILTHLPWSVWAHTSSSLLWTCWYAVICQSARVAELSEPFASSTALQFPAPKIPWVARNYRRLSQFVPLLLMLVSHRCMKPREFSCRDVAALPPPGHQANASEQAEVETWEALHVSLELDCRKKWKCQKGLVCRWLKWLWHEGTEGCQNQVTRKCLWRRSWSIALTDVQLLTNCNHHWRAGSATTSLALGPGGDLGWILQTIYPKPADLVSSETFLPLHCCKQNEWSWAYEHRTHIFQF